MTLLNPFQGPPSNTTKTPKDKKHEAAVAVSTEIMRLLDSDEELNRLDDLVSDYVDAEGDDNEYLIELDKVSDEVQSEAVRIVIHELLKRALS